MHCYQFWTGRTVSMVEHRFCFLRSSPMQVGSVEVPVSAEGLFPAVGMHSMGEEVKVDLQAEWLLEEDDSMMMVDSHEDDWGRLYDVRVSGTVRSREKTLLVYSHLKDRSDTTLLVSRAELHASKLQSFC